jgi:hypothetical protein
VLEGAALDPETRRAIKRRLNPLVDLAAAAEDKITPDGYGLAHNAARGDAVRFGVPCVFVVLSAIVLLAVRFGTCYFP